MNTPQLSIEPKRIELLGVPVDLVNMQESINHVRGMLTAASTQMILAVNPEKVIAAQRNPELRRTLEEASLVIPDGIGVVLAARILSRGALQRVAGADLMPEICAVAAEQGKRVFFYGAKQDVVTRAAAIMQERFPSLQIVGTQHGYVPEDQMMDLADTINASGAEVLFVGLGSPRQELWMDKYREQLTNVRVCQGIGGTFDAICGNPPRAPLIFQKLHLEWFYRLISQPQRLLRQTALPRFVLQVFRQAISPK